MYESLKNRIAALEEEEVLEEEEEKRFSMLVSCLPFHAYDFFLVAEEAVKSVKGLEEAAIHTKYIELVQPDVPWLYARPSDLSLNSLRNSSAWNAIMQRRNRNSSRTKMLVGSCI